MFILYLSSTSLTHKNSHQISLSQANVARLRNALEIPQDCRLCKDLVKRGDKQKIMDAACKVMQARDEVVVDAEWKRHSSAMLAKDTEGKILKRIRVLSDSGVSPEVICSIMGVQSDEGGCTCPSDLTPFHALGETLRALSSDRSGTSASEVESSLN